MGRTVDYNATLISRTDLTDRLAVFRVRGDATWGASGDGRIPDFQGGQYAVLGMNHPENPEKGSVQRPYSIASSPDEKRWLEFYIRYVDEPASDNPLTHLLWTLRPGDRLHLGRRITGHFTLGATIAPDDARLRVFVAAGTGLAPFISMLKACLGRGVSRDRFAVLHGARNERDLGYREELGSLFQDMKNRYLPTISRPHESQSWDGDIGRVEAFFDQEKLETLEQRLDLQPGGLRPENAVIYICGLYGTIRHTLERLLRRGFVPNDRSIRKALRMSEQIPSLFFEQYDSTPVLDLNNPDYLRSLLDDPHLA